GLKYPGTPHFSEEPGKIYVLDLHANHLKPVELRVSRGFDLDSFNPHGISVYIDETDHTVYLFVVNHPNSESTVEIFRYNEEDNSIAHLKTIKHELLHHVNDIVAVGPESFYATNDHYFSHELLRAVEMFLDLPWCDVIYYTPEGAREVAAGFNSVNGINISPDNKYIYVVDILAQTIHVMEIQKDKTLTSVKAVQVGSLPDNIEVDRVTGDVWLGCHPNAAKMAPYDPQNPPGSEVIQIKHIHSETPEVRQVYADDGSVIQGSSIAVAYQGRLLIGSVFHKMLICDLE
ncbi:PON2 arylesterase, partial [Amia calva]|nr:PON2 arylesterase [Amia calva]